MSLRRGTAARGGRECADELNPSAAALFDEVFDADGAPRDHAAALVAELDRLGADRLVAAGAMRDAIFMRQGITFDLTSADGAVADRPFPLDLIPRIIPAAEWRTIKRGLAQRIRALNQFVDDVYHEREIIRAGIVPWTLVASRSHFARAAHGIRPPRGVYTHIAGCDLVRDEHGSWKVLEDNVRTPSGISYMLENRIAMTRLIPSLFAHFRVRPVDQYPALLHAALRSVAPVADGEATIVVWTPGPANSAYFEHTFLARQMGVELVEASDLVVRDDVCYMRTTSGLARVNAIYRRLDDAFIDPLEFRPDSLLGVPGLIRAYRAGTVAIANAIGTGSGRRQGDLLLRAGDDPLLPRRGAAARERHDLPARRPRAFEPALARIDELVFKPTGESGGIGVVIGPDADERRLAELAAAVRAQPRAAGSPRRSSACPPCRPSPPTARSPRATSTCAPLRSSARRSGSSPAA